ncbi:hypothetical protein GOODEAATRI_005320 [Goodea atripinnis]|uniref:Uncharacterized protein n=1 Tax=Goodea atripinnis TaxID=208336 RepID=A0ABV0PVG5_9TELE
MQHCTTRVEFELKSAERAHKSCQGFPAVRKCERLSCERQEKLQRRGPFEEFCYRREIKEMLAFAEPKVSTRRIQIGIPSSKRRKRKGSCCFISTPAFPNNPSSTLLILAALFRQHFDVCSTRAKGAQLGSYPGIIKCPWVPASTLNN